MRTLTTKEAAAIAYPPGYSTHSRVKVLAYGTPAQMANDASTHLVWRLEGTGNETSETGGYVLNVVNAAPLSVAGVVGKARQFVPSGFGWLLGTATGGSAAMVQTNNWTVEIICRIDALHATAGRLVVYGGSIGATLESFNTQLSINLTSAGWLQLTLEAGAVPVTTTVTQSSGNKVPAGTWCHIAAVRSGTSLIWYINGAAVQTQTVSVTPTGGASAVWSVGGSPGDFSLIQACAIDEVRVSSVARSAAAVLASYQAAFPATNPVTVDLTAYNGQDWLEECSFDDSVDQPVAVANVTVRKQIGAMFLDPFHPGPGTATTPPVIQCGRPFSIETATVPLGAEVQASDWKQVFDGVIDDVESSGASVVFNGRDRIGALLQDTFIEENDRIYSVPIGTAPASVPNVETVMQQILDNNGTGVTLFTPISPAWKIFQFKQKREPVMDALRNLALQIGWDVRYRFDNGTSQFRLTFYEPSRTTTTSLYTWTPNRYRNVTEMKISRADVRNAVEVIYSDSNINDPVTGVPPARTTVKKFDEQSSIKYGRRWMQIAESSNSNINTSAEADRLATAALLDLKEPFADVTVDTDFSYFVQPGDYYTFSANGQHFVTDTPMAVVSVSHKLARDTALSTMSLRAKPIGGWSEWLSRDSRPGIAPPSPMAGPPAPASLTATSIPGGARIAFAEVVIPNSDPLEYELHVSEAFGFTPSALTFRGITKTTTFDATGLIPGITYYAKIVARDSKGNRGTASGQVTFIAAGITTEFVAGMELAGFILNPTFEDWGNAAAMPPGWTDDGEAYSIGYITQVPGLSGSYAVQFPGGTPSGTFIQSSKFSCCATDQISANVTMVSGSDDGIRFIIQCLDAADNPVTGGALKDIQTPFGPLRRTVTVAGLVTDNSTRSARIIIEARGLAGGDVAAGVTIDSVSVSKEAAWTEVPTANSPNWGNAAGAEAPKIRALSNGRVECTGKFVSNGSQAAGIVGTMPVGYRPNVPFIMAFPVEYVSGGTASIVSVRVGPTGLITSQGTLNGTLDISAITYQAGG